MFQVVHEYLHKDDDIREVIFYITLSGFPYHSILDLIRLKKKCIVAWTSLIIYTDNSSTVTWIETHKEYRNKSHATQLLKHIINYCKNNSIVKIQLDDMTNNYRKDNNLYIKAGFEYVDNSGPEMIMYL